MSNFGNNELTSDQLVRVSVYCYAFIEEAACDYVIPNPDVKLLQASERKVH